MDEKENLSMEDALPFIFGDEGKDRIIDLSFNGLRDAYELFLVSTKLLICGLRYVYEQDVKERQGGGEQKGEPQPTADDDFNLEMLSETQLNFVKYQMYRSGIVVNIDAMPATDVKNDIFDQEEMGSDLGLQTSHRGITNSRHIVMNDDASKLDNHVLVIATNQSRFVVGFSKIIHDIPNEEE
jgi:hypothetical protein